MLEDAVDTIDQDMELLNSDPQSPESDESSQALPETEEKPEESEEEKEEEKEEGKEEEKEDVEPVMDRPSINQLKTSYPEIFKKFPGLRGVLARESEFSKIFPTPQIAQETMDNSNALDAFRESAVKGDATTIFEAIKAENSLDKFAANILPALHKMDQNIWWEAVTPVLENTVRAFYAEGKRFNNENVMNAASHLSQYLFGDERVASGEVAIPKKQPQQQQESEVDKQRRQFETERYVAFKGDIDAEATSGLNRMIMSRTQDGKLRIDPDGVMSKFTRDALVQRIAAEVDKAIGADQIHMNAVNRHWADAKKGGFSSGHKARIIDAYLARAKSLIPSIRQRLVSEALGTSKGVADRQKQAASKGQREPEQGKVPQGSNGVINPKTVDWRKTSDEDLLSGRVTLRK